MVHVYIFQKLCGPFLFLMKLDCFKVTISDRSGYPIKAFWFLGNVMVKWVWRKLNEAQGFFILWSNFPGRYKKIQFQEPSLDPSATLHCALSDLKENERGVWPNMYRDGLATLTRVAFLFFTTTSMDFFYSSLIWRIGIQIFGTGTVNYAFLQYLF